MWKRTGECPPERCRGRCCTHVGVWLAGEGTDGFVEVLRARGMEVKEAETPDGPTWLARFEQRCQHLLDSGLCGIYGKPERPQFCADWPVEPSQLENDPYCGYSFVWVDEPQGVT